MAFFLKMPLFFMLLFFLCLVPSTTRSPITCKSFNYFTGQSISVPQQDALYYASPSPYLFTYDNYSQKIKSINIENGEYNVFHQVNFEIGQILFFPQGMAYISNQTAGNQILQWNYLASFQLQPTILQVDLLNYKMKSYYPVYDQYSSAPASYFFIYNSSSLKILDLNGVMQSNYTDNSSPFVSVAGLSEQRLLVSGGESGQVRVWNFTIGHMLNNTYNFSEYHYSKVEFLERVKNARKFISADNVEKKLRIWSLDHGNLTGSIQVSFGDWITGIKSISNRTAVIYGNGFSLDYINIETVSLITTITLVNKTIVAVEVLPVTSDTKQERIAILTSDGLVGVYILSQSTGIVSMKVLFMSLFPQINKINHAMTFKKRNSDNTVINIMAVVSDTSNNTVYFLNENTRTNVTSFNFSSEVRGLYQIMARYLPVFQDMLLVWYGDSFSVYSITDDHTITPVNSFYIGVNKSIISLGIVYEVITYSFAYVAIIDQNNITSIVNLTGYNMTYFNESNGIKFFCEQNFFTNFAYALPNDTLLVYSIDVNFTLTAMPFTKPFSHPNMTSCFSKNIEGAGYFMTSNASNTMTWMIDGTPLSNENFTNISSLLIEGNPLFTAVNSYDDKVYEAVTAVGAVANYSVGYAPGKNGFLFQFLQTYFYSINERELAQYYMDCPFGTTQSSTIYGTCFPACNNSFISLTNSSCVGSCLLGTYPTPIVDVQNNFTAMLCQSFNKSILNCDMGFLYGNDNFLRCTKCEDYHYVLATNGMDTSNKWNFCAFKGLDGRLAALSNSPADGSGVAKYCNQYISNCYMCNWNVSNCDVCEWTFYRELNGLCSNCTNNTVFHNGSNNGTGFCYNCSVALPYCYICNGNSNNCTQCFNNYFFDEYINLTCSDCSRPRFAKVGALDGHGYCRNCSNVINQCLDCSEYGERCTLCEQSFYIDVDYNCTDCAAINKYKNGSDSGSGYCEYCNYSLPNCLNCYGDKTNCQQCMSNYYFYTDHSCVDCKKPNLFLNGSNIGSGHCYDCSIARPNCNICNNNPNNCDLCFANYFFDENDTCSSCSRGMYPTMYKNGSLNGSGHCLYCQDAITNCNQCTDNATACTRCNNDFYIVYQNATCTNCQSNTSFFNSSNDGNGICYPCSVAYNHCKICDNPSNKCLLCEEDYFLNEFYRCQPYTFRPQFTNNYEENVSFSIVNNRKYAIFYNPCMYDKTVYSLDARLHSYWISSMNFGLIDKASLWDIEAVINTLQVNETQPNYTDPAWTFWGNSLHNSLIIAGRSQAHYKVKYFCVYGNTFSDDTKPGLFDFYMPDNTGDNGLIFMNMDGSFVDDTSSQVGLMIMACGLQYGLGLGDTDQIIDENGETCGITLNSVNFTNVNSNRLLQSALIQSNDSSLMTYIFNLTKNHIYANDQSATQVQNALNDPKFLINLQNYFLTLNSSVYYPNIISASFVLTTDMMDLNISYPSITLNFTSTSNKSGTLNIVITGNDGIIIMGIEKNNSFTKTPNYDQLIKGNNGIDESLDFHSKIIVKQNQKLSFNIAKLNAAIVYAFYYCTQNLYGTNTSNVTRYVFSTDYKNLIVTTTGGSVGGGDELNIIPIIVGVVVGVVGTLIIVAIVMCMVHRNRMKREQKLESEKQSEEEKHKYNVVSRDSPQKPLKPQRPGDVLLPSMEAFPSTKDIMKLETEIKEGHP